MDAHWQCGDYMLQEETVSLCKALMDSQLEFEAARTQSLGAAAAAAVNMSVILNYAVIFCRTNMSYQV